MGLSQSAAVQTLISGCQFSRSGLENLTIDDLSFGTRAIGNSFFRHLGGCGNIGWDDSSTSIFSNNRVDNENDQTAPAAERNGVCVNAVHGVNNISVIADNVIQNCKNYGIYLRDRSGEDPVGYKAGSTAITGNIIRNSQTADIHVGTTEQVITVKGNNYETIEILDAETDVRVGSGEIGFEGAMTSDQTVGVSSTFSIVGFNTFSTNRLCTQGATNKFTIPAGGFYSVDLAIRFTGLSAASNPELSARVVYPGGSRIVNQSSSGDTGEIDLSFSRLMGKGNIYAEVRFFGGSGNVTLDSDAATTYLTAVLVG